MRFVRQIVIAFPAVAIVAAAPGSRGRQSGISGRFISVRQRRLVAVYLARTVIAASRRVHDARDTYRYR